MENIANLETLTDSYFNEVLLTSLDALLAPIVSKPVAGESLAGSQTYTAIRSAREEEDASLPLGAWERELKRADWPAVSRLCIQGLTTQSKDLQLATWLLEAELHRQGLRALGPCLSFVAMLSETYWQQLYPLDLEHRENLFRWINEKLLNPLRRVPFTATGSGVEYGWADWEQAQHNEQVRAALGKEGEKAVEGTTLQQFTAALACTPSPELQANQAYVQATMQAIAMLQEVLDKQLGDEAPTFAALHDLAENISLMLASEARKRGLDRVEPEPTEDATAIASSVAAVDRAATESERGKLYAALAKIAEQLARLEPHSPVPYLIKRAVSWGQLNTAQLYSEVFVRCGGQINIFELLGLEDQIAAQDEHASR